MIEQTETGKRTGIVDAPRVDPLTCSLCGLPVGPKGTRRKIGEETASFCCHGCLQVFLLLSAATGELPEDFRESELYRVCVESGIIAGAPASGDDVAPAPSGLPPLEISYGVEGMWCPSCAWLLEEVLRRTRGVVSARVTFVSDVLTLTYLPNLVSPSEIVSRAGRLGYRLGGSTARGASEARGMALRLGIASIFTANIMMVSLAVYSGLFFEFSRQALRYFSYPVLVAAGFVLFYSGLPTLKRGLIALRYRSPSMDSLIAIGGLSAFLYSSVQVIRGSPHLYFDTASMLVTFVLFGRYVEARARERVSTGVGKLRMMTGGKVRIEEKGRQRWIAAETVRPGDRFLAAAGDSVPVDSLVAGGAGLIDRSFLTGESRPLPVAGGDPVAGGSLVREGELLLEAQRPAQESLIGQVVATVEQAMDGKNASELLAERVSRFFVPAVLCLALATAAVVWLYRAPADVVLLRSLTVLLISCPCALGLAIPLAKVAMIDRARRQGIVVRAPEALERLREVDTLIFDKTGTVTKGDFSLQVMVCPGFDEGDVLSRLAAVEARASHFIAKEIVREARRRGISAGGAEAFESVSGLGVRGRVRGDGICIGSRRFMELNRQKMVPALLNDAAARGKEGETVVFFGWKGRVRGFLAFGDPLREGVRELVERLRKHSITLWLVSGDGESTTRAVAGSLRIEHVLSGALPDEKAELVKDLQRRGHRVAMVGDGINDAAALAESDVGVAFGAGMDLVREASDLTFLSSEPHRLFDALSLAATAARTTRQNLVFAFAYNVVAIPIAAFGLLNPLVAVVAMFASSLTVTANTLRMARVRT